MNATSRPTGHDDLPRLTTLLKGVANAGIPNEEEIREALTRADQVLESDAGEGTECRLALRPTENVIRVVWWLWDRAGDQRRTLPVLRGALARALVIEPALRGGVIYGDLADKPSADACAALFPPGVVRVVRNPDNAAFWRAQGSVAGVAAALGIAVSIGGL
jgi:hypothetical protein